MISFSPVDFSPVFPLVQLLLLYVDVVFPVCLYLPCVTLSWKMKDCYFEFITSLLVLRFATVGNCVSLPFSSFSLVFSSLAAAHSSLPAVPLSTPPAAIPLRPQLTAAITLTTNQERNLRRKRLSAPAPESAPMLAPAPDQSPVQSTAPNQNRKMAPAPDQSQVISPKAMLISFVLSREKIPVCLFLYIESLLKLAASLVIAT